MATALANIRFDPTPEEPAASRKLRGAIYTPSALAAWVAELVRDECADSEPSIVDFGCGEGSLLDAARQALPGSELLGVETNALALARAKRLLSRRVTLVADDVLRPTNRRATNLAAHWRAVFGNSPSAVIMNPPWGAAHELSCEQACKAGLRLAQGQFDTYDLFCELAIQTVTRGGAYGFILPDSLFLPEHRRLRELLLQETTITLIARLGEGIFPGIYRGCVVVAGKVEAPPRNHLIECLRVTKKERAALKLGSTFASVRNSLSHRVAQSRFANDPESRFDIDVTNKDETVSKILQAGGGWTEPLNSRRGAEISKSGKVLVCSGCGSARPLPKSEQATCFGCGDVLSIESVTQIIARAPNPSGAWARFIAGEDVRRYSARSQRWIRTDLRGISYKAQALRGEHRLLVRKTGVGLNAAIDTSGSFTNQVVFEYTLDEVSRFPFSYLHYVLGVLCSRTLFAFHLKRGGDLEWRSHPYVTQKTLAALPIPVPRPGTQNWNQAAAIAGAVGQYMATGEGELEIESLIAGLYRLNKADVQWALAVLDEAADLEPMRLLRLPQTTEINPLIVA